MYLHYSKCFISIVYLKTPYFAKNRNREILFGKELFLHHVILYTRGYSFFGYISKAFQALLLLSSTSLRFIKTLSKNCLLLFSVPLSAVVAFMQSPQVWRAFHISSNFSTDYYVLMFLIAFDCIDEWMLRTIDVKQDEQKYFTFQ